MSEVETVERLTDIVVRQSRVIKELHSIVAQLDAVTTIDEEIKQIQKETKIYAEASE